MIIDFFVALISFVLLRNDFVAMQGQHYYMANTPSTAVTYYGREYDQRYIDRQLELASLYDSRIYAIDVAAKGDCSNLDWLVNDLLAGQQLHRDWIVYFAENPELAAKSSEASLQPYWVHRYDIRLQQVSEIRKGFCENQNLAFVPSVSRVNFSAIGFATMDSYWKRVEEAKEARTAEQATRKKTSAAIELRTIESPEDRFRRGYRDAKGPERWLEHFIVNVGPCESSGEDYIDWTPRESGFLTAFQFHPGTLETIEGEIGLVWRIDPYDVGKAVATWINMIGPTRTKLGSTSGWPVCFWRGLN